MIERRYKKNLEKSVEDKLDELVVECFDQEEERMKLNNPNNHQRSNNVLTEVSNLRKLTNWHTTIEKMYKRRLDK